MIRSAESITYSVPETSVAASAQELPRSAGQEFSELMASLLNSRRPVERLESLAEESVLAGSFAEIETTQRRLVEKRSRDGESENVEASEDGEASRANEGRDISNEKPEEPMVVKQNQQARDEEQQEAAETAPSAWSKSTKTLESAANKEVEYAYSEGGQRSDRVEAIGLSEEVSEMMVADETQSISETLHEVLSEGEAVPLPKSVQLENRDRDTRQAIRIALTGVPPVGVRQGGSGESRPVASKLLLHHIAQDAIAAKEWSSRETPRAARTVYAYSTRTLERIEDALAKAAAARDGKTLELRLDPPELGRVKVVVRVDESGLHAKLSAESADVVQLLRDRSYELQSLLRSLGFDLEKITVSIQSDESFLNLKQHGEGSDGSPFERSEDRRSRKEQEPAFGGSTAVTLQPSQPIRDDHWIA